MVAESWRFEPTLAAPAPQGLPRSVGQYDLLAPLGQGGMGYVCKARHRHLQQVVAIKFLTPKAWGDPQAIARFYREMQSVGRVVHSNLVRAFDAGEYDGHHVLVTEYVVGQTLQELLKRGPLPIPIACECIRQAALGLAAIHASDMIHRDVKPSNLMLSEAGIVKILDLGLARLPTDEHEPELTDSGYLLGTIDYMAPEQSADARSADHRSDLYSLGCTLYAAIAGFPPFGGPSRPSSLESRLRALREMPPPPLVTRCAGVPSELGDLIERLLAKNPDDRPQSAEEVVAALAPFAAGTDLQTWFSAQAIKRADDDDSTLHREQLRSSVSVMSPAIETSAESGPRQALAAEQSASAPANGTRWIVGGLIWSSLAALGFAGFALSKLPDYYRTPHAASAETNPPTPSVPLDSRPVEDPPEPEFRQLRDLSQAPDLTWIRLLEEQPVPIFWKEGDGLNTWDWSFERQHLWATNDDYGLLGLGAISEEDYTLQVSIHQSNWTSGVGIFLGLQGWNPETPDAPWSCLYLQVNQVRNSDRPPTFRIELLELTSDVDAEGERKMSPRHITFQNISDPVGEVPLELQISGGKVSLVRFNGELLRNLRESANLQPNLLDWRGGFGILVNAGQATIRSCQFMRTHVKR